MTGIIVIGGGPAGVMAALTAADRGAQVELWERNRSLGRKLAITGKGRCNVTNATETEELVRNLPGNGQFLYGAFSRFGATDVMDFFEQRCGLPLKTERGRRVFPASDRARDVVEALERQLELAGIPVLYQTRAKKLALRQGRLSGVYDYSGALHPARAVVVATGGVTYPATGSTGDGYALAEQAGHSIVPPKPSLVPLATVETWVQRLSGLSLKNVELSLLSGEQTLDKAFGEMLFTHFGVSGPMILSASSHMREITPGRYMCTVDLKPALSEEKLDERLIRDFAASPTKGLPTVLRGLLPKSLVPVITGMSGIDPSKHVNGITRDERREIVYLLKNLTFTVKKARPIEEAIVTSGGVKVNEIDPKTMQSKKCEGLFFAGEVIDVDAYTGGFNLQIAFSTGAAAGRNV